MATSSGLDVTITSELARQQGSSDFPLLDANDPELAEALKAEVRRERDTIELIASENYVGLEVLEAQGSVLTNKYAEGYPGARWYGGCERVDVVERLAIKRAKDLFGAEHANVQPHSGSQANAAAYMALLDVGDRVLSMSLPHGGHLTHGHKLSFSGQLYDFYHYGVDRETERIDYDQVQAKAEEVRPKIILAGASAYPRIIDSERLRQIADSVDAYLVVDIAHIAGLVAAGLHPSPVPYADIVTTTTHKTLRGPRGGMILCKKAHAKAVDRAVFPGVQGGPLEHIIAAKAAALGLAMRPEFQAYQAAIIENAQAMAERLQEHGARLTSGGTDNHLMMVDALSSFGLTGRKAAATLERAGIACNKNQIPFDTQPPVRGSGVRLGTPAITTRGFGVEEAREVADLIVRVLKNVEDEDVIADVRQRTLALCEQFPLPY